MTPSFRSMRTRALLLSVPGLALAAASTEAPADDGGEAFMERCMAYYDGNVEGRSEPIGRLCGCMLDVSASELTADEREMLLLSVASPLDMARMTALGEDVMESMSEKIEASCT